MKKLSIVLIVPMLLALVAGVAAAQGQEAIVYSADLDGNVGDPTDLARCWKSGGIQWYCNDDQIIEVSDHLSLAQWVNATLSATHTEWQVLKPGQYVIDCISFVIQSNGDVGIVVTGFGDKVNAEGDVIETYWAALMQERFPGPADWMPADQLDGAQLIIEEDEEHNFMSWKIWEMVCIEECNSACEYWSRGLITVTLLEQKPWYPWVID